ncbi:MAG TPA: response regulator [Dehalococcoidia bacterium]|nr:response regulator [Dehalococcoidia bacterium]
MPSGIYGGAGYGERVKPVPTKTSVLLFDSHEEVLSALAPRLKMVADLDVVGETGSLSRALDIAARVKPGLIIADFGPSGAYAAAMCARISQVSPESKLVVYTPFADEAMRQMYADAGATACLLKDIGSKGLVRELQHLISGDGASRASRPVRRGPGCGG